MTISRRRLIAITAAATLAPHHVLASAQPMRRWAGKAMGARVSLAVSGMAEDAFAELVMVVEAEISRLEDMFSLYKPESDLARLNAAGRLDNPPADFVRLLSAADTIHHATGGAFDPTIQPLWRLYADTAGRPDRQMLAQTREATGWQHLRFGIDGVSFARPGMAMTLNGIAQGYATDQVADLLRGMGLRNVLVSVGEIMALGEREPGMPWRVGIAEKEDGRAEETIELRDRAIATSAPGAMVLGAGDAGHILDPLDGRPAGRWQRISVTHRSAAIADGLSTAFCAMSRSGIETSLRGFPGSGLVAVNAQGERFSFQS